MAELNKRVLMEIKVCAHLEVFRLVDIAGGLI